MQDGETFSFQVDLGVEVMSALSADGPLDAIDVRYVILRTLRKAAAEQVAKVQEDIRKQYGPVQISVTASAPEVSYDEVLKELNKLTAQGTLERSLGRSNIPQFRRIPEQNQ